MVSHLPVESSPSPALRLRTHWFGVLLTGLLFIVAIAKYRHGPVRVETGLDLATPYACTRAWLEGLNPYVPANIDHAFQAAGGQDLALVSSKWLPPIYPPITFIALIPFGLFSWEHAIRVWELVAPFMIMATLAALLDLAGLRWRDPRAIILLLFCLVFAPTRTAFTLAQNAVPAICFAALSLAALRHRINWLAGVLLAVAIAFKMQDALFVLLYFVLIRRWRAVAWCAGILATMMLIAVLRVGIAEPGWIFGWLKWIGQSSETGAIIDSSSSNSFRFHMIHFSVLLQTMMSNRMAIAIVNAMVCGSLLLFASLLIWRKHRSDDSPDLLAVSALGTIILLPIYHRFPDAMILLFPMAWAISMQATPAERFGRATLILLLIFLMQPAEVIPRLLSRGVIPSTVSGRWWWECIVRPSIIWAILVMGCWLVYVMARLVMERAPSQLPVGKTSQ